MSFGLFVIVVLCNIICQPSGEIIHKHTSKPSVRLAVTPSESYVANVTYDVVFSKERCCPILEFYSETFLNAKFQRPNWTCCDTSEKLMYALAAMTTSVAVLEHPNAGDNPHVTCIEMNTTHYQCKGTLQSYSVYPDRFSLMGCYLCSNINHFDISYDVQFIQYESQPTCVDLTVGAKEC